MKTILLIEDDTALRENTAELLELSDYHVLSAPNGKIGIEIATSELPNLIVCDIMMPVVDGYGVIEAVSQNPKTAHIPFIFLSAKTEHKEIRKGMNLGADDYLTKPFEEEELISAVESRLAKAEILLNMATAAEKEKKPSDDIRNLNELKNLFDDTGQIKEYKKGDIIYKENAFSRSIFLILKGVVKSHKMEASGKELITALHKPDDFLGFTSFSSDVPYQETTTAVEDVTLVGIFKEDLLKILSENQNITIELVNVLSQNISKIKEQLLQMAYSSVKRKTAQTILQFTRALNKKPNEAIKISRSDLASVAGIATESLIRTLSEFKKKGYIEIEGRNIKIIQIEALKNIE
ncbi:transcriptional regulator [unidentified eubacterium SCB49]|nr:transcriptional regulator [unidentified eubacterium SCB49]